MLLAGAQSGPALPLDRELSRLPKEQRPTKAQIEAAKREASEQERHEQELWRRIEPEVLAWAKKGKPFLPAAAEPGDLPQASLPAFPGAEGAGKYSFGGRGGKVFVVTSLNDTGPGTFREACEAAGPRMVVFNVAGIVHLKQPVHIRAPYITIAGQTAPGDGVCIAGRTTHLDTHDVVIRYLRFRRGATDLFDRDDCLGGNPIGNIIVDHCSCSWGLDENLSLYRHVYKPNDGHTLFKLPTLNITIQWCLSSEALDKYGHAFGGTWGGKHSIFHHNLFACNTGRNPSIGMGYDFNFINNVLFNWRHRTLDGGDQSSLVNCINNYYKPGPVTPSGAVGHRIGLPQPSTTQPGPGYQYGKWYVTGNYIEGDEAVTADNWAGGVQFKRGGSEEDTPLPGSAAVRALIAKVRADKPFPMAPVTIQSAQAAYAAVLADAGATLPRRDAVDQRIIEEVRTGKVTYETGEGIIQEVRDVGGYPDYEGQPVADLGPDGIPAWWKRKYGLDPKDPLAGSKDCNGDGYTNLEKYLNGLDPKKKIDWRDPKNNVCMLAPAKLARPERQPGD